LESGEYKGIFKAGKRHGHGILKFEDGTYYEGKWVVDQRSEGMMKMTTGTIYIG
jgi:hypothetical protein